LPEWARLGTVDHMIAVAEASARVVQTSVDDHRLLYIARATGACRVDNATVEVSEGDLVVAAPGRRLTWLGGGGAGWLASFASDAVHERTVDDSALPLPGDPRWPALTRELRRLQVPRSGRRNWVARFADLERELTERPEGFVWAARSLITLLSIAAGRLAVQAGGIARGSANPVLAEVAAVVEARFRDPVQLHEIAYAVAISPRHLSRLVRQLTGRTLVEWVEDRRMEEARRLLTTTAASIDAVARESGFSDRQHLSRRFRLRYGIPPSAWRRALTTAYRS
jgi:AraC family transcriptional regulator, transcriptional activator of pobA